MQWTCSQLKVWKRRYLEDRTRELWSPASAIRPCRKSVLKPPTNSSTLVISWYVGSADVLLSKDCQRFSRKKKKKLLHHMWNFLMKHLILDSIAKPNAVDCRRNHVLQELILSSIIPCLHTCVSARQICSGARCWSMHLKYLYSSRDLQETNPG